MPKYQVYFDTVSGEIRYNVDIDEEESLQNVLDEILFELGSAQQAQRQRPPQVLWSGQAVDFGSPLPEQGIRPNDILRVSTIVLNG